MTKSVAATDLAKLGKCEAMIRFNRPSPRQATGGSVAHKGSSNTLRGELAHARYESTVLRFMTNTSGTTKHRFYQLVFSATVALGVLTLLAAWITT
ncbi:hypothetical protein F7P84_15315 [Edwardsiella anguillarum]|nr:hypothetical protein F7P84_15315 [Edwardsiella anguillarum]QBB14547.1 hypothetical protein EVK84_18475 [Edwardsiella piscicida]